jgi:phage-related protein (TIGR01555 family)
LSRRRGLRDAAAGAIELARRTTRAARVDGWVNALAGLGDTVRDKAAHWSFRGRGPVDPDELGAALVEDDVTAAVAQRVPDAMLGRGFQFCADTEESQADVEAVQLDLKRLDLAREAHKAATWDRGFGGAALLLGADDGRPLERPLDPSAIRRVHFVRAVDARDCTPMERGFGSRAELFHVRVGALSRVVHRSRLVLWEGTPIPERERRERNGWGGSRVELAWGAIQAYHAAWAAVVHLLHDGSQGIFAMDGVVKSVAAGREDYIRRRVQLVDEARSIARAIVVDRQHEQFTRSEAGHLTGIANVLREFQVRLAQASGMPVTILLGRSPAGLNATGESDLTAWYDSVGDERTNALDPRLRRVVAAVQLARTGPTRGRLLRGWALDYGQLWRPTEREAADVDAVKINTLATAASAQLVEPEAARRRAREILELPEPSPPLPVAA